MERRPWGEWDHPDDRALSTAEIVEEGKKVGSSCYASFSNMKKLKSVTRNPPLAQQRLGLPRRRHSDVWSAPPLRRHTSLPALSDAVASPQHQFTPSSASALSTANMRPHSGHSPGSVASSTDGRMKRLDSANSAHSAIEGPGRRGSKEVLTSLPEGSVTPGIALPWSKNRTHLEGRHSPRRSSKISTLSPRKSSKNSSTSGGATSAEEKLVVSSPTSRSGSKATPESPASQANQVAESEDQESPSDSKAEMVKRRSSNTLMRRASCPAGVATSDSLGPLRKRGSIAKAMDAGVTVDSVDIVFVMSCEERIPYALLKSAYTLFEEFAKRPEDHPDLDFEDEPVSVSVTQVWRLSQTQFVKLIPRLPNIESEADLPRGMWPMPFQRQSESSISFKEFAIWLWSQAFSEDMVLTHEDRNFRDKTRESGLDCMQMDKYKHLFDRFAKLDAKNRIVIGPEDFGHCVSQLMKLPVGESLPPNRLKSLWMQADKDGNGVIDFMEFIEFYKRNFQSTRSPSRT